MKRVLAIALGAIFSLALAGPVVAADPVRPFGGVVVGVDTTAPPVGCPDGTDWRYVSIGSGQIHHLGRVDLFVSHCSRLTSPTTGVFGDGTITLTAANGDTVVLADWGTFEIVFGPDGGYSIIDLHWEVIGGSGRFANATGSGGGAPVSDFSTGMTAGPIWGEIAY